MNKVRIDKWLWAARFFKTRSLAKQAIEGGKVRLDGLRVKPSKDIMVDQVLTVRQGSEEKEIIVTALSEQRRGAVEAALLYRETQASLVERDRRAAERKALRGSEANPVQRPTKKQRRQIHQFREQNFDS